MANLTTYSLLVKLVGIDAEPVANVAVVVELFCEDGLQVIGTPAETFLPNARSAVTDSNGTATFELLPSSLVGNYRVSVAGNGKKIIMPANDVNFAAL